MDSIEADVLILGAGAAGLSVALALPESIRVVLVAPDGAAGTATQRAQGGLAAAIGPGDSSELHATDTLRAGGWHGDRNTVQWFCEHAPDAVRDLLARGLPVDGDAAGPSLTLEGGHTVPRILHHQDRTGALLMDFLRPEVAARANVTCLEGWRAVSLLLVTRNGASSCAGAVLVHGATGEVRSVLAGATVLATGGLTGIFPHHTGPSSALGDGIVMAAEIGADLVDLEFVQFHPTALVLPDGGCALLTEALRGEGAELVDEAGAPLITDHPLGSLAPRDVVARAVAGHLARTGTPAGLDLRRLRCEDPAERFPNAWDTCRRAGLRPEEGPVPVTTAAHYTCGGVRVGIDGATSVDGMWAIGEVAGSGLHGANRLASNSLTEALVMATPLARSVVEHVSAPRGRADGAMQAARTLGIDNVGARSAEVTEEARAIVREVRAIAGRSLGVVRTPRGLLAAERALRALVPKAEALRARAPTSLDAVDALVASRAALLVARAALRRRSSLGTHTVVAKAAARSA